ncbi:hypothetical protein K439DRAFT_369394 [Ramaria rubella]|nr:hypothetical protein K439DRAFT_369394 [Ramaria rubella]
MTMVGLSTGPPSSNEPIRMLQTTIPYEAAIVRGNESPISTPSRQHKTLTWPLHLYLSPMSLSPHRSCVDISVVNQSEIQLAASFVKYIYFAPCQRMAQTLAISIGDHNEAPPLRYPTLSILPHNSNQNVHWLLYPSVGFLVNLKASTPVCPFPWTEIHSSPRSRSA